MKAGWILIQQETDEFYGIVQYRDSKGKMTDETEIVERNYKGDGYVFCNSGLGELKIIRDN